MRLPKISIAIPYKSPDDARLALQSLAVVAYPQKQFEIILINGNQPAMQRNAAVAKAKGEIIYFLDNDSRVQKNSLKILAAEFSHENVDVVGGPSLTPKTEGSYINQLIGFVLETMFGSVRMRYRYKSEEQCTGSEYSLLSANLAIRKTVFKKIGGFNEKFYPNEETELLRRLKNMGFKLHYSQQLFVYRNQRKSIFSLMKQFFSYGKGRMQQIITTPNKEDLLLLLPIVFLFYLGSLLFIHSVLYFFPVFLYSIFGLLTALKAAWKYKRIDLLFTMPFIFPIIHVSYAVGQLVEAVKDFTLKKIIIVENTKIVNLQVVTIKNYTESFRIS